MHIRMYVRMYFSSIIILCLFFKHINGGGRSLLERSFSRLMATSTTPLTETKTTNPKSKGKEKGMKSPSNSKSKVFTCTAHRPLYQLTGNYTFIRMVTCVCCRAHVKNPSCWASPSTVHHDHEERNKGSCNQGN